MVKDEHSLSKSAGLAEVERIFQNRPAAASELKALDRRFAGYLCCYVPVEIITAAGLAPYRLHGDMRKTPALADGHLETIMCSFARSAFDQARQGRFDFLDGIVFAHSCDNMVSLATVWQGVLPQKYAWFVNVPHIVRPAALEFFEAELAAFKLSLERYLNRRIHDDDLRRAIAGHNELRRLIRELYQLRQPDPPLLSGVEATKVVQAVLALPLTESLALVSRVIQEVKARSIDRPAGIRLMIHGARQDDTPLLELIEGLGAVVVIDDLCTGTRPFWRDVPERERPLRALAEYYLTEIKCPRTIRPPAGSGADENEARFGHIKQLAREWGVKGVILDIIRFCDTYGFDVPDLKAYLGAEGLAVLHLEEEYLFSAEARLKTRIEAFLEIIGG
ncbi:MAG: 2-hydroxyacyl-CoA dehydratase family protein [Thermodesulfobacteriota bacterium]